MKALIEENLSEEELSLKWIAKIIFFMNGGIFGEVVYSIHWDAFFCLCDKSSACRSKGCWRKNRE